MGYKLEGLNPQRVFKYFEEITRIPRESGNEAQIAEYLVEFAEGNDLEVIRENSNNIIIKKPASSGYEGFDPVILQGHTDMVCTKKEYSNHDFLKDSIELIIDGDYIKTKETTLGADNGIAVAMAMSVLSDKDLKHPRLEALFTVAEETGMDGASLLESKNLDGKTLINIDSEEEGVLLASCAGGANCDVNFKFNKIKSGLDKGLNIKLKGLQGGHSGIEINKNRANAIKLMARMLKKLSSKYDYELISINGGEKMNAIAKFADASLVVSRDDAEAFTLEVDAIFAELKGEYAVSDPEMVCILSEADIEDVFAIDDRDRLINALRLIPYGVQTMSSSIHGLVESSNNIGVIETVDGKIKVINALRSSVKSLLDEMVDRINLIADLNEGSTEVYARYPEWQYKIASPIRDLMVKVYKEKYDKDMKIDAIHAGLECGLLKEKLGDIDMISLGPEMHDVHTPQERLSISSTERVYEFLVSVLESINW